MVLFSHCVTLDIREAALSAGGVAGWVYRGTAVTCHHPHGLAQTEPLLLTCPVGPRQDLQTETSQVCMREEKDLETLPSVQGTDDEMAV